MERALSIAEKVAHLFDHENPAGSFVMTDGFVSPGRISGAKKYPDLALEDQQFSHGRRQGEFVRRALPAGIGLPAQHPLKRAAH